MAENFDKSNSGKHFKKGKHAKSTDLDDLFNDVNEASDSEASGNAESDSANDFARMFEDSMTGGTKKLSPGDKIRCEVLSIGKEEIFVSTGTIDDGMVHKLELNPEKQPIDQIKVGDFLDLFVMRVQGSQILLSQKLTSKNMASDIEDAFNMGLPIEGKVSEVVNGGFRVAILGQTAFCPISQLDSRRIDDGAAYIGRKFSFLITQFDSRGRNIVVSRRKLLDQEKELSTSAFTEGHKPGEIVHGLVTRVESFGAFVEVAPGLEGLCHVSELSWSRVADAKEVIKPGDDVRAKILKIEEGMNGRLNISLSIKQASETPWHTLPAGIAEGSVVEGRVTRCMKFGAFVEVAPGLEGLVPLSEMSYTKRVLRSDEIIHEGEKIQVLIKEINIADQRMLLSIKDTGGDPFAMAGQKFSQGTVAQGRVERKESYGIFVKLDEGIVGLLPKSKTFANPEFNIDKIKVGDQIVVQVDEIREQDRKISLSIPSDPEAGAWKDFSAGVKVKALGSFGEQFKTLFAQPNEAAAKSFKKN
jgi:small subunit ribosomal protein S1